MRKKKILTTNELFEKAADSMQVDFYNYSLRANILLNELKRITDELESMNEELNISLEQLIALENFIFDKKQEIKIAINNNTIIKGKISNIINPKEKG